jgi:hypothetical protein
MKTQRKISSICKSPEKLKNTGTMVSQSQSSSRKTVSTIKTIQHLPIINRSIPEPYETEQLIKATIVQKYINSFPKDDFKSKRQDYRKVLVLQDNAIYLSPRNIKGHLLEIPKQSLLLTCNKKEKQAHFIDFLAAATKLYINKKTFSSVFLRNGTAVFSLQDIPESEVCIYVSYCPIFKGLQIVQVNSIIIPKGSKKNSRDESNFIFFKFRY